MSNELQFPDRMVLHLRDVQYAARLLVHARRGGMQADITSAQKRLGSAREILYSVIDHATVPFSMTTLNRRSKDEAAVAAQIHGESVGWEQSTVNTYYMDRMIEVNKKNNSLLEEQVQLSKDHIKLKKEHIKLMKKLIQVIESNPSIVSFNCAYSIIRC